MQQRELLRNLSRDNPAFLKRVIEFNLLPLLYATDEALERIIPELNARCALGWGAGTRAFSRLLLKRMKIKELFLEFDRPFKRAALLDAGEILRLILLMGAVMHRERIAAAIGRRQVEALKRELGEEVYTFALKRAPLVAGSLPRGIAPETENLAEDVKTAGTRCFSLCFCGEPEALRKRLELKLPGWFEKLEEAPQKDRDAAIRLLERLMRYEVKIPWLFTG